MPAHIGTVPEYGIEKPEKGVLIESLESDGQLNIHEQLDHKGRKSGVLVIDQELSFSLNGAIPAGGGNEALKMGATLALANEIPDIWNETPTGTTVFIKGIKDSRKNSGPATLDVSGTIYAFGASVSPAALKSGAAPVSEKTK